jgi:hypothetical protein
MLRYAPLKKKKKKKKRKEIKREILQPVKRYERSAAIRYLFDLAV